MFQQLLKAIIPKAEREEPAWGRIIKKKVRYGPAPSIFAESSSSLGKVTKNWRIKKIPKILVRYGSIMENRVSVRLTLLIPINRGIMVT